ncbi:E3 ubiquitin ligase family protein [Synechococcus sp. CS-1330]|nr:E3 ubiquitin ligase family protein [Synechococcus sp. CS-1330]
MDLSLLLIPALLGSGAVGTGLARRHQARKLAHLLDARTSSVAELIDLQATVAEEMGEGSFQERVKLSAEIVCAEPLTAPWSGEPCVAFIDTTTCLMEVRTETTRTDSDGNSRTEVSWERREETLDKLERRQGFELRQGSQSLLLKPDDADLELETVFAEVEPPTRRDTADTRQLGIRREEAILRASGMAFVVGECRDASGELLLQAPQTGGLFVVRRGNEEEFSRAIRRWRRIWMVSTWVLAGIAIILLLTSL